MTASPFLDMLRTEVARMQATHPEREGDLSRAHALIVHGMVVPSPDDPATGQVLSSDLQKVYHVNGVCDCDAGQHGRTCKHVHGWRLYQYVQRKVEAQAEPHRPGDSHTPDVVQKTDNVPLPEAVLSLTLKGRFEGQDALLTVRGMTVAEFQTNLAAVRGLLDTPQPAQASSQGQAKDWCSLHNVSMQWNPGKDGRKGWYSHKTPEGQWCQGRARR